MSHEFSGYIYESLQEIIFLPRGKILGNDPKRRERHSKGPVSKEAMPSVFSSDLDKVFYGSIGEKDLMASDGTGGPRVGHVALALHGATLRKLNRVD
jgi:hypothetical protein